jgi:ABC-type transport system involved in multi-copper enzyme maturation permease subunit
VPFLVRAVQVYASANVPQVAFLAPSAEMFRDFLGQQQLFVFVMSVYVGSGLIANDRRANALQIYFSKPLTRGEYIGGKLAILEICLLLITWVPAVALLLIQVLFAGNFEFIAANGFLLPAITLSALVQTLAVAFTVLGLSSLSNSSRYVAILVAVVIFFTQALYGLLYAVTRDSSWAWVSFGANLSQISHVIFRSPVPYSSPWQASLLVVLAVLVGAAWILRRNVRAVEFIA